MMPRHCGAATFSRPSGTGRSLVLVDPGLAPWAMLAAPLRGASGRQIVAVSGVGSHRLLA